MTRSAGAINAVKVNSKSMNEVQAHLLEDLEPNAEVFEREEERTPRVSAHLFTPM